MKNILIPLTLALAAIGCNITEFRDTTPPLAPSSIWTETGDNFIELFWSPNTERDLAGYNVFVSNSYNGRYELIASTNRTYFLDNGARNGNTYYYAVTAFDFDGNESPLSRDVVYDVPRPEGYGVIVNDFNRTPQSAGYDFSSYAVVPYNDLYADMYFEYYNGAYYMNVRSDTDIQDMGYTNSLLDIRVAPSEGWSPTHDVLLRVGHTYVVWTFDDHYAKFRVTSLSPARVVFDWAYQLQRGNPLLKRASLPGGERRVAHEERVREGHASHTLAK